MLIPPGEAGTADRAVLQPPGLAIYKTDSTVSMVGRTSTGQPPVRDLILAAAGHELTDQDMIEIEIAN